MRTIVMLLAFLGLADPAGLKLVAALGQTVGAAAAADPNQSRGLDRGAEGVQPIEGRSDTSAGLFIGVNEFAEDASLRALRFAVNDAIGLAYVFCIELKLIPPANATLALAGQPDGDSAAKMLAELKTAGVAVEPATKSKLFNLLLKATAAPQHVADLLIVAISSHGFEHESVPYAMPADGVKAFLKDTGLSLVTVENELSKSKAGKRLLFLDACREKPLADAKAGGPPMSEVFKKELAKAAGQAVLASCDVGQYSWESEETKQGVFTQFIIEGLRGKAPADGSGLIRMSLLADYVAQETKKWSQKNVRQMQEPWFKGKEDARQIPLAVDPRLAGRLKERLKKLRELAIDEKLPLDLHEDAKWLLSGAPDDERARQRREIYERLADGLTDPATAITAVRALRSVPPAGAPPSAAPAASTPPASAGRPGEPPAEPERGPPAAPPVAPRPTRPEEAILGKWVLDPEGMKRVMLQDARDAGMAAAPEQVAAMVATMAMEMNFSANGTFTAMLRSPDVNGLGSGTWTFEDGEFEITMLQMGGVAVPVPDPVYGEVHGDRLVTESSLGVHIALKRPEP